MRVLLINPKSKALDALPIPPLGILYIAAYIRERGYTDIKVIDDNRERLPIELLEEEIKKSHILGLTGTTSQYVEACKLAALARKHNVISVYGGPHASALPEEALAYFDIAVRGEGERAFLDIIENGGGKGIYEYSFIKDLDTLPFPARDLVPILEYPVRELKRFAGPYTHMMTGRGCNSKCIFCNSPEMWKHPRLMSAERVFQEMMEIFREYGIRNIHFQDDTFTLSRKRTLRLCDLILDYNINFRFSCQTRPDMVDEGLLKRMAEAGCVQVEYGVESGDPCLLKIARKEYSKQDIKRAFKLSRKAGITTYGFFIVGLPGETIWSWLKSIFFALRLKMDSSVWTVMMPYPGTAVYKDRMVKILNCDYTDWLYKRPIIKVGWLGPKMLMAMRNIADVVVNGLFNKGTYRREGIKNES